LNLARMAIGAMLAALSDAEVAELEPVLYAHALRAVGDPDAARDLVQETLLAALAGRSRFEGRAKLRTWAVGILTHKVMDFFRARSRAHIAPPDDTSPDELAEPAHRQPDRVLARREALGLLDAGIRELPELERLAVLLVDIEGFDRDEACRELAITGVHLRVLLHRGRHRLRRILERAGVSHGT
jgi:RNA polymerase sigma-70 factor, ECF subfamily